MKTRTARFTQLAAAALTLAIGSTSAVEAAPAPSTTTHNATSTTFRDAPGDVVLSDGAGPYTAGGGLISYVRDFPQSTADFDSATATQDFFWFSTASTGGARSGSMTSRLAILAESGPGAAQPIPCVSIYSYFESHSTPDWYEALASDGTSVTGFATTGCYTGTGRGYHVAYPSNHPANVGECVVMSRVDESRLRMSAPEAIGDDPENPACLGQVYSFVHTDGVWTPRFLGFESAPLGMTMEFAQVAKGKSKGRGNGGGNGKGNGKGLS